MDRVGLGGGSERLPEQESLTETLFRFAVPVSGLRPDSSMERLKDVLILARKAWNSEVVREMTGDEHVLDSYRKLLQELPDPLRAGSLVLLDRFVARKRAEFAGDLRAVGDIDVHGEGAAQTLTVHELSLEDLFSPRRDNYRPNHATIDMQTYLPEDGLMRSIILDERVGARTFGAIAAQASLAAAGAWIPSGSGCVDWTGASSCKGHPLLRRVAHKDRIDWECPLCGKSMVLHSWRGTPWDLSGRQERLAALPAGEILRFSLSNAHRRALQVSVGLHVDAVSALVAAQPGPDGWQIEATREEVEDLAVAAGAALVYGARKRGRMRYVEIAERLHGVLGRREPTRMAAGTADILCFQARARRSAIRGVPRVPECGAHRLSVVLRDIEPPAQREILVRSDTTLEELHAILQVACGWCESRPHAFRAGGQLYVRKGKSKKHDASPTHLALLSDVAPSPGDSLVYEYGLREPWQHAIQVTEVLPPAAACALPRCLQGEGAATLEEIGGAEGFDAILTAVASLVHEHHGAHHGWRGGPFDLRVFDLEATNRLLRQLGRWQA
ncbi:MAG TPA: plasmid pRiA4b ORF-3 family protein [Planctomycetota bacterium]|nr:plasmid pRiA4b ORF-3 family protein [Planctomycetota bacterium]